MSPAHSHENKKNGWLLHSFGQHAPIAFMDKDESGDSSETKRLIERAAQGEPALFGELFQQHRDRLRRLVMLRLDHRLQSRIDPSDVLQEAFVEASARLHEYTHAPTMPFFLWLRLITGQRLQILHRHHLGTKARDAGREISLYQCAMPEASSAALAAQLLGRETRASEVVHRSERKLRLQEALNGMDPLDREILALRHTERLTNAEAGQVMGISESAAAQRHFRALRKLKDVLSGQPGGLEDLEQ